MEHLAYLALLLDVYGPLLTTRQQEALHLRAEEDLSLGEIAGELGISRPAVADLLRRGEEQLRQFEARVGLLQRRQEERTILAALRERLTASGTLSDDVERLLLQLTGEGEESDV